MLQEITFLLTGAILAAASISDIKTREVPDWLNYSATAAGIGINLIYSLITWNPWPIVYSIAGVLVFLVIASIMFYGGQWGGGDSKMLIALGAILGLQFSLKAPFLSFNQTIIALFMNLMLVGVVYALLWSMGLAIKHREKFTSQFTQQAGEVKLITIALLSVMLLFFVFVNDPSLRFALIGTGLATLAAGGIWAFGKSVEKSCMLKNTPTKKLTEGDWIAKEVRVKGKYICGPKDLGIEKSQIRKLIKLNVKKVLVKEGIPFVPAFFLAFLVTLKFGNLILVFVKLI